MSLWKGVKLLKFAGGNQINGKWRAQLQSQTTRHVTWIFITMQLSPLVLKTTWSNNSKMLPCIEKSRIRRLRALCSSSLVWNNEGNISQYATRNATGSFRKLFILTAIISWDINVLINKPWSYWNAYFKQSDESTTLRCVTKFPTPQGENNILFASSKKGPLALTDIKNFTFSLIEEIWHCKWISFNSVVDRVRWINIIELWEYKHEVRLPS